MNLMSKSPASPALRKDNMKIKTPSAAAMSQNSQITQADPAQLIVLLYTGAIALIAQGQEFHKQKDMVQAGLAISKAQAIVGELRQVLDMDSGGDIAKNLDRLYAYLHELMVKAMLVNKMEPLNEAAKLLTKLREAWTEVAALVVPIYTNDPVKVRA
jgi:flagellar secretion chaperone FliS